MLMKELFSFWLFLLKLAFCSKVDMFIWHSHKARKKGNDLKHAKVISVVLYNWLVIVLFLQQKVKLFWSLNSCR